MILPNVCLFCKNAEETIVHLFLRCPFTKRIWDWLSSISCWLIARPEGISELMQQIWTPPFSSLGIGLWRIVVPAGLWSMWKERNLRMFEGHTKDLSSLLILLRDRLSCGRLHLFQ
ncbi:hypothetical protein AMTRI_Chr11g95660 [Amborella trichopoda]